MAYRSRRHKSLHVALAYNAATGFVPDTPEDRGSTKDLRQMIRHMARVLRSLGHRVTIVPLAHDLFAFQRKWRRLNPDVVFNQYDDVVHGALHLTDRVIRGLRVHPERMARNLDVTNGLLLSEQVMLALGHSIGRQTAHDVVYECAMRAIEQGLPFRQTLAEHPDVALHLSAQDIERHLDPVHYTGLSGQFVDRVMQNHIALE